MRAEDRVALLVATESEGGGVELWDVSLMSSSSTSMVRLPWACAIDVHPHLPVVYAVSSSASMLVSLDLSAAGRLKIRDRVPFGETLPCALAVSPDASHLVVAHYQGGSLSRHRLAFDGSLGESVVVRLPHGSGPAQDRQDGPHPHQVGFTSAGELWVSDLGADRFVSYAASATEPRLMRVKPGSGPRHFAHIGHERIAVVDELTSCLSVYRAAGDSLIPLGSAGVGQSHSGSTRNYPSDLAVHPSGHLLYVANRGANSISVVSVTGRPAVLQEVRVGRWPQSLQLTEGVLWCAARDDDQVLGLPILTSGRLGPPQPVIDTHRPVWVERLGPWRPDPAAPRR